MCSCVGGAQLVCMCCRHESRMDCWQGGCASPLFCLQRYWKHPVSVRAAQVVFKLRIVLQSMCSLVWQGQSRAWHSMACGMLPTNSAPPVTIQLQLAPVVTAVLPNMEHPGCYTFPLSCWRDCTCYLCLCSLCMAAQHSCIDSTLDKGQTRIHIHCPVLLQLVRMLLL